MSPRLVSLTFDGTTIGHLEVVAPALIRLGLPATYYARAENLLQAVRDWQEVARHGAEIGDGCLDAAALPGGHVALDPAAIEGELAAAAELLDDLFPGTRSFGYPWGEPTGLGGADYRSVVRARYEVARAGIEGRNTQGRTDLGYLRCIPCDGYSGEELIALAENGLAADEWVIFAFGGIGEGEPGVDLAAFLALVEHLAATEAPVASVIAGAARWRALAREKPRS